MRPQHCLPVFVVVLALVFVPCGAASGEVFVLTNGGQVEGELVNTKRSANDDYVIRTAAGGRVTLESSQVKTILSRRPAEIEYEKIRPRYPDTVEGQWALAEWCRKNHLRRCRKTHLKRIIEIEPDHKKSRAALGYMQFGGKWRTQEQIMNERGMLRYNGRWYTPQQVEVIKKQRKRQEAEKAWYGKLKRWGGWLGGNRTEQAQEYITDIDDPSAVKALAGALKNDGRRRAQVLYVEALARIGTADAMKVLAIRSLEDPDEEIRLTCLDYLKKEKNPPVVRYYIGKLKHKDNRIVNLSATALGRMNDPTAVGPLIDVLVTVHKFKVTSGSKRTSVGFSSTGGMGFSAGSSSKIIHVPMKNQAVLDALIAVTGGVNFNYDQKAWKYWHHSQKRRTPLDARRD